MIIDYLYYICCSFKYTLGQTDFNLVIVSLFVGFLKRITRTPPTSHNSLALTFRQCKFMKMLLWYRVGMEIEGR